MSTLCSTDTTYGTNSFAGIPLAATPIPSQRSSFAPVPAAKLPVVNVRPPASQPPPPPPNHYASQSTQQQYSQQVRRCLVLTLRCILNGATCMVWFAKELLLKQRVQRPGGLGRALVRHRAASRQTVCVPEDKPAVDAGKLRQCPNRARGLDRRGSVGGRAPAADRDAGAPVRARDYELKEQGSQAN